MPTLETIIKDLLDGKVVQAIQLDGNNIGSAGTKALANAIGINRNKIGNNIKHIHLNNNNIGDEGVVELARVLKENKELLLLTLSSNNITAKGAMVLAGLFRTTP